MRLPKSIQKIIIRPPFTPTSARMTTSPASTPRALPAKAVARLASAVNVQSVPNAPNAPSAVIAQNVMAAVARRVAVSAMTSVRRVVPVKTSPCVKITPR